MGTRHGYWAEKLHNATRYLASSGPIQKRLYQAFSGSLVRVRDEQVPPSVKADFDVWKQALTRVEAMGDEGAITATTRTLSDDECEELAKQVPGWLYQLTFMDE